LQGALGFSSLPETYKQFFVARELALARVVMCTTRNFAPSYSEIMSVV